ncbi:recombinase family protein [Enterococcus wangshanyuanii]|uniref:DNA invertase n=1 Tax=Enterococcus wangshanyuanii TaxID=2005703 RepID=A0ABQ1PIC6_9ENTE|nr:recombinase family protein [Enterococcus wangshanyuanii]GGC97763.1 DNA invertase [Enterococcus wangshanyuanii]
MEKQQQDNQINLEKMDKVKIGYARVSSQEDKQRLGMEVQKAALSDCDVLFTEKESGGKDNRLELMSAITLAKELASKKVDVSICVYRLDRLTRRMFTLISLIEEFNEHNIRLISLQENLETDTLVGKMLCISLGFVAEMELDNIRSRTRDGLQRAKLEGKKLGNKGLPKKTEEKIIDLYTLNSIPIRDIAKRCNVAESTIYNVARRNNLSRRK